MHSSGSWQAASPPFSFKPTLDVIDDTTRSYQPIIVQWHARVGQYIHKMLKATRYSDAIQRICQADDAQIEVENKSCIFKWS